MNLSNLKPLALALAIAMPLMASAAAAPKSVTLKGNSAEDSVNFYLGMSTDSKDLDREFNFYNLSSDKNATYTVVVDLTITDMTYRKTNTDPTKFSINEYSDLNFDYSGKNLFKNSSYTQIGNNEYEFTFTNLKKGSFEFSAGATWDDVTGLTGARKTEWITTKGKLDLDLKSVALTTPVPEPESYAMFLAGLGLVGTIAARRRKGVQAA